MKQIRLELSVPSKGTETVRTVLDLTGIPSLQGIPEDEANDLLIVDCTVVDFNDLLEAFKQHEMSLIIEDVVGEQLDQFHLRVDNW